MMIFYPPQPQQKTVWVPGYSDGQGGVIPDAQQTQPQQGNGFSLSDPSTWGSGGAGGGVVMGDPNSPVTGGIGNPLFGGLGQNAMTQVQGQQLGGAVVQGASNPFQAPPTQTVVEPVSELALWAVAGGVVGVLVGSFWLVWAMVKKQPKAFPSAVLALGVVVLTASTRSQAVRAEVARYLGDASTNTLIKTLGGWVLRPFGVVASAPPASSPPASSSYFPPSYTPPVTYIPPPPTQTQPPPIQPPPPTIDLTPDPTTNTHPTTNTNAHPPQTQPDKTPLPAPIIIDPRAGSTTPLEKRFPLRWPDGEPPADVVRAANSLRTRTYNAAGDELQGAFSSAAGTLGPWWAEVARRDPTNLEAAAVALAQMWAASEPERARASLGFSQLGVGYLEVSGKVIPYRVRVTVA